MRCLRCGGLMSCDWFTGGVGTDIAGASETWRCVNCGEIIDDVILHNRRNALAMHFHEKLHEIAGREGMKRLSATGPRG